MLFLLGIAAAMDLSWHPCSLHEGEDDARAECTTATVPLDHGTRTGAIEIGVKRLKAPQQPARGQIWFLTGGPGDSGLHDIANLDGLHDAVPDLDLIAMDPRGMGANTPIDCPAQRKRGSKEGIEIVDDEWDACIDHVSATYAERLPFLTTTQTAEDLLLISDLVRDEDDEVYLWGVSYGSFLANRALVLRPDGWAGVVVDGIVPADWSFVEFDANLDRVARDYLALCADDKQCRERLGGNPVAYAQNLYDAIDDGHCKRLGLDTEILPLLNGVFLMAGDPYSTLIPPTLYHLDRCKPRDIGAFVHLFDTLFPEDGDGQGIAEEKGSHNPVLQRQIAYADLWDDAPSDAELKKARKKAIATTDVTLNFAKVDQDWPSVEPDPLDDIVAVTDVPMLLLHGGLDPTMPVDRLADTFDAFSGPNQTSVVVPFANHVTFNAGDCPIGMTTGFFNHPRAAVDSACVAQMKAPKFGGKPKFDEEIWGRDRWDDRKGCGGGGGWLFLLLPIFRHRKRETRDT